MSIPLFGYLKGPIQGGTIAGATVGASEVRYKAGAGEVRAEVVWREARFCIEGAMHPNGRQCESDHVFRAIESDFGGIGISELHGKKRDEFR